MRKISAGEKDISLKLFWSSLVKVVVFSIIFCMLFSFFQTILQPKWNGDGAHSARIKAVSQEKPDVVFIGSSQCTFSINPLIIFRNSGIDSCVFSMTGGTASITKYHLEEAIRVFHPKMIVIEPLQMFTLASSEVHVRIMLDPLEFSFSKLSAVKEMINLNEQYDFGADYGSLISYAMPLLRYHSRWNELTKADFDTKRSFELGQHLHGYFPHYFVQAPVDFSHYNDITVMPDDILADEKNYFQEAAEICQKNNVQLVVIKTPSPVWRQARHDVIAAWAEEYGVPFVDQNDMLDELGINVATDFMPDGMHLNDTGASKVSAAIGEYLRENYDLPDHRGEEDYADWDEDWTFYQIEKTAHALPMVTDLTTYLEKLRDHNFTVFFTVKGSLGNAPQAEWEQKLQDLGLTSELTTAGRTGYIAVVDNNSVIYEHLEDIPLDYSGVFDGNYVDITSQNISQGDSASIQIAGKEYFKGTRGLGIVVYDKMQGQVADSVTFDLLEGGKAYR